MTKQELVRAICHKTGKGYLENRKDIMSIINAATEAIKEAASKGENTSIRGFGTFRVITRAAKSGRNITANTPLHVPACKVVKFKAAPEFKSMAKGLSV